MTDEQKREKTFEVFAHPTYGIRAIAKLFKNYQKKYGLYTIADLVDRYAPSYENDTTSYADNVASIVGIDKGAYIDLSDTINMDLMLRAIIYHENGIQPYTWEIEHAIKLA